MHVLLTEASFGDADFLVQPLRDTGCRVSRCHNRAGLCRALVRTSACPLDERTDPPVPLVDVRGQGDALTAPECGTDRPDVVAVVRSNGTRTAASGEWARYVALRKVGEPPLGTVLRPVSLAVLSALAGDNFWPGTAVRIVRPEWGPALKQFGADPTGQSALLVTTTGDTRREHVLAGAALHGVRLSAAVRGFATRVVPMAASERARYLEESLLPGIPQGLVLVG